MQEALVPGASSFNKIRNDDYLGAATDVAVDAAGGKVLSGIGGTFLKRVRLKAARGESLSSKEQAAFDDWMPENKHGNDVNSNAPSGYYRAEFESGMSYNGVGLIGRMWQSIKGIVKRGDKLKSKTHTPTKNKEMPIY